MRELLREEESLELLRALAGLPGCVVLRGAPLKLYTTYKIGGPAALLIEPMSELAASNLLHELKRLGVNYRILGGGSNLLVGDLGVMEPVISTRRLKGVQIDWRGDEVIVTVGAGVKLSQIISLSLKEGLSGLESLAGIPATLGGAVVNNASAYGVEMGELVEAVELITPYDGRAWFSRDELNFGYRSSSIKGTGSIVLKVRIRLKREKREIVMRRVTEILERRRRAQPLEYPSCGSVFKNPPERRAWELIDLVGLRGYRIGNAAFSEKHANFIVNLGEAKASDVMKLMRIAQARVKAMTGVELEPEVEIWE